VTSGDFAAVASPIPPETPVQNAAPRGLTNAVARPEEIMMRVGIASANAGTPESIERSPMELGMIGLGRMGTDMVRRLLRTGPEEKAAVKKRSA